MIETKFKNTEIGLIPEDWEVDTWGNVLTTFSSGATPYRGNPSYYSGSEKWISSGELNYNVITDTIEHISTQAIKDTNLTIHKPGTFLMAITGLEAAGTRGRCAFVGVPSCTNQSCLAINSSDKMIVEYLFWFYLAHSEILAFKYAQGTKQQSYTANIVKNMPIIVPPLPEQRRIAEVLSQADELIKQWENVIAKKRDIKTATMQLLLTGKKRLNGFDKPWVEKKLGEVAMDITTGKLDANAMVPNGQYRFYTCAENYYFIDRYAFDMEALLISGNGANLGYIHYYKGKFNAYQRTYVLSNFSDDIFFIKWYLEQFLKVRIESEKSDSNTPYIKMDTLTDMSIFLPPDLSEQRAIAEILSDMDEEIKTLEAKVEKLRNIKSGMMQQLLSGKIRLVGDDADNVRQFVENNFGQMPYAAEDEAEFGL